MRIQRGLTGMAHAGQDLTDLSPVAVGRLLIVGIDSRPNR
jgi:hypothetical protein